jgi:hypothetical protein
MHWISVGILIGVGFLLAPIVLGLVIVLFEALRQLLVSLMEMVGYALMIFVGGLLVWGILAAGVEQFSQPFGVLNLMRAILGGVCFLVIAALICWPLVWFANRRRPRSPTRGDT